jgi:uncharacterized protein (DUF1684 family)
MDVTEMRRAKDDYFGKAHDSPLTVTQRQHFEGLRYFDVDPAFRFEVALEGPAGAVEEVEMSDGSTDHLQRAGAIRFSVEGSDATLVAYRQGDDLFIPFRDATSGKETYGAGRYLEAEPLGGDRYLLDFNRAYNPYCAYNATYECPFPPPSNRLNVAIRAGEKAPGA